MLHGALIWCEEALAARTNLPDLLEALREAGAHIEPEVWHTATAVIRTDCLPRGIAVQQHDKAEDPAFEAKCALARQHMRPPAVTCSRKHDRACMRLILQQRMRAHDVPRTCSCKHAVLH